MRTLGVIPLIALVVGSLFGDRGILHLMTQRQRAEALLDEGTERERARAIAVAATVRLGGASAFLLLSMMVRGHEHAERR